VVVRILWDLDQHGRILDEEEHIDVGAFATKAIDAILPVLTAEHEWTEEFAKASNLRTDFEKALRQAAADHRRRHHTILRDARVGSFGSSIFSNDGKLLLYHTMNDSTQRSMRVPEKLPHVVVYDIDAGRELHRLSGHTDAIMWSAISPDQQCIASVSWDGTLRMYLATTGNLMWATEKSGGQSWAGAFTPDSTHIIWSSNGGRVIQVLDVIDGLKVSTFPETLTDWSRDLVWHPAGDQVALCVGQHAYVWRPFDGADGTITQHFVLDESKDWHRMASVQALGWMEDGRALALQFSDGSKMVYDMETNSKEVFARPKGIQAASVGSGFYGVLKSDEGPDFYISVDGDGKVRYWSTSVPARPSWWEKEQKDSDTASKKAYPETGKYVNVTKVPKKGLAPEKSGRDTWAEKGAELWTAE
jgi:WD40 repeat protein